MYSTVIGNGRTLQEDTVICGYNIPKGIQVVFPTIVTGTMEEYCTNANTFKPERWLKMNQGGSGEQIHPFASLPYGYGARMCLGRRFADLEMQILLAKVSIVSISSFLYRLRWTFIISISSYCDLTNWNTITSH